MCVNENIIILLYKLWYEKVPDAEIPADWLVLEKKKKLLNIFGTS